MNKKSIGYSLRTFIESMLEDVHTAMPGRIEKYDYATQKASVQPLIKRRYPDKTEEEYPVIPAVPVIMPRSGSASLTFPINAGDTGLLLFTESSMDRWLSAGGITDATLSRRFDLTDGVFIPGLYPFNEASPAENNEDIKLELDSGNKITIKPNGDIEIGGSALKKLVNDTFKDLFNNHVHAYVGFVGTGTVTPGLTGTPSPIKSSSDATGMCPVIPPTTLTGAPMTDSHLTAKVTAQ